MKYSLMVVFILFFFASCATTPPKVAVKPNEHMEVGWTPRTIFQSPSYAAWFDTSYANYQPQQSFIDRLKKMHDSVQITVVYGTWCSDSKREVPRFFKVMDMAEFPAAQITLIAVDRTMQIPPGIKKTYNITNVPTFIITYTGVEIGRIIETPRHSLEEDLATNLAPIFP
jgi:thiol-disulfide isomerase/thioredoxin